MQQLEQLCAAWGVRPDGQQVSTRNGSLLPVKDADDSPLMIKVALSDEERAGLDLLQAWRGRGAVAVIDRLGDAVLMPRAISDRCLIDMAQQGGPSDTEATRILCHAALTLHSAPEPALPALTPLTEWFRALGQVASSHPVLGPSAEAASRVLGTPYRPIALHGDLHHGNVLDFGDHWAAIDPKGLLGAAEFDFCVMFANPDLIDPAKPVATLAGALDRRFDAVIGVTDFHSENLLRWISAWSGLSAAWFLADDHADRKRISIVLNVGAWAQARLAA